MPYLTRTKSKTLISLTPKRIWFAGKYVIRLFWMGCWRKVTVDDNLPVDPTDHVLLPSIAQPDKVKQPEADVSSSQTTTTKKTDKSAKKKAEKKEEPKAPTVQLWPFVLSKALLKIASLTWNDREEIVDFDIIHCLTGWIVQKVDARGLTVSDKWEICKGFTDHYAWAEDFAKSPKGVKGKGAKGNRSKKGDKKGKKSVPNFLEEEDEGVIPYHLVVTCGDMR